MLAGVNVLTQRPQMEEVTTVCKAKVVVQKPNAAKEDTRIKVEE